MRERQEDVGMYLRSYKFLDVKLKNAMNFQLTVEDK